MKNIVRQQCTLHDYGLAWSLLCQINLNYVHGKQTTPGPHPQATKTKHWSTGLKQHLSSIADYPQRLYTHGKLYCS
jgi:hypothetical protein